MPEVRDHEPAQALYAGAEGMEVIERLLPQAAEFLRPEGWLMMEVAAPRAAGVVGLFEDSGFWQDVRTRDDYAGLPRVVRARLKETDARHG
jgi:release factor glutamine methyltransferase